MNTWSRMGKALLLVTALSLSACHTNLYTTPRTMPTGKVAHTAAIEMPLLPIPMLRYGFRVGVAERVDLGFALSTDFKVDLKLNVVRSRYFDMAIDPTLGVGFTDGGTAHFGFPPGVAALIPVLMGFNFGRRVTLVLQGGPLVAMVLTGPRDTRVFSAVAGIGCQIRATDWFAIHPEISGYFFEPWIPYPRFGLGFVFGEQPKYDK